MAIGRSPARFVSIPAGSADDETLGAAFNTAGYSWVSVMLKGTGTTSSGVVTIECADWDPATATTYTGTWHSLGTVNASDVTGGAQKLTQLTAGALGHVRARISTAIGGGGSIEAVILAQAN